MCVWATRGIKERRLLCGVLYYSIDTSKMTIAHLLDLLRRRIWQNNLGWHLSDVSCLKLLLLNNASLTLFPSIRLLNSNLSLIGLNYLLCDILRILEICHPSPLKRLLRIVIWARSWLLRDLRAFIRASVLLELPAKFFKLGIKPASICTSISTMRRSHLVRVVMHGTFLSGFCRHCVVLLLNHWSAL